MTRKDFFLWVAAAFGYRRPQPSKQSFSANFMSQKSMELLSKKFKFASVYTTALEDRTSRKYTFRVPVQTSETHS